MIERQSKACFVIAFSFLALSSTRMSGAEQAVGDVFAEIAAQRLDYENRKLTEITPPRLNGRILPLDAAGTPSAFQPAPKMATEEQVREELLRQRELHAPFLRNLAPALPEERLRVVMDSFDWRIQTDADRLDFTGTLAGQGNWQRVKIPHYGPPMGRAVTYYRTAFNVTRAMLDRGALFVCFKGVDLHRTRLPQWLPHRLPRRIVCAIRV